MSQTLLLVNLLVGGLLPLVVAFVTHSKALAKVKVYVLLAVSVLGSLITSLTVASFNWKDFLLAFATQYGTGVLSHLGLLKPVGLTGDGGAVSNVGLGVGAPDVSAATEYVNAVTGLPSTNVVVDTTAPSEVTVDPAP